ncbi:MAG: D-alanyl-D-alanine carboxypeptidase, partial [Eubacterium sp.]|nr:D-alanyl-D-alanine carboxypeptidase [Eubacterium sp.]
MKRFLTMIFVFLLILVMGVSPAWMDVRASGTDNSDETDEASAVNLLESEDASDEDAILEDTGSAYDLIGLSGSPDITAESATVMDARSGEVIYAKQADAKRYPASITKVMTTLIAIENCKMDEIVEFTSEVVNSIEEGSSTAGINAGAKLTMEDTLYALMLVSANEAGAAVADHVAGSNDAFAKMMTDRAKELGCKNTNFRNPHGLPDEKHYTTAHDMGLILK